MAVHDLQEAIIVDDPERLVGLVPGEESEVGEKLAEPDIRESR